MLNSPSGAMSTPQWLKQRIESFIPKLALLSNELEIKQLCEEEVQFVRKELDIAPITNDEGLTEKYKGKVNALHTYLTEYRNYIKEAIPCTNENSYEVTIGKFASKSAPSSRRKIRLHFAHRYLKKNQDETPYRAQTIKDNSDVKRRNPKYFYSHEVIAKAVDLLNSSKYSSLALGLMLLTGRRQSEILKTAKFEVIDSETILFSGQLKTRDCPTAKTDPFPIPVLADSQLICEALARLRSMPEVRELADKPVKSCNGKAATIGRACETNFSSLIKDCIPKDLRAAYAQICLVYRRSDRDRRTDYEPYFAEILGHATDDLDTSKKYKLFELLDGNTTKLVYSSITEDDEDDSQWW